MRILYLYTDYFQNFDILWALLQHNQDVEVIDTPFMTYSPDENALAQLESRIRNNHYDFVMNFGYVPYLSDLCNTLHIPYVCWTYDSILHSLYNPSIENPYNILFVYDRQEYLYLKEHFSVPHLYHLPLAANIERIQKIIANTNTLEHFTNDISFVGDLYQQNTYVDLEPILTQDERLYFEQAFSYFHGKWGSDSIYDWFSKADADFLQQRLPDYLKNDEMMSNQRFFADILLSKPIGSRERIDMLNLLAKKYAVSLYHKAASDTSVLKGVTCKPAVNYYDEMNLVFRHSKINLNSTLHGMVSGIPLRCFDIMASGGFLLTNYQSELLDFFTENQEIVIYRNFDELEEKVDYFLKHEQERSAIAYAGFTAVCNGHTYHHRVTQMLTITDSILS